MTWSQSGLRPQSYATWCLCSPPRCYTAHTGLALLYLGSVHSAGFVTPVTKANTMKCNLLVFPQQKKCTITYITLHIKENLQREGLPIAKVCPDNYAAAAPNQSIIRGRIEKKSCQNFQLSQQSQKAMTGWMQRLHKSSQIRAGDVKSKLDSRRCNLQF